MVHPHLLQPKHKANHKTFQAY